MGVKNIRSVRYADFTQWLFFDIATYHSEKYHFVMGMAQEDILRVAQSRYISPHFLKVWARVVCLVCSISLLRKWTCSQLKLTILLIFVGCLDDVNLAEVV